MLEGPPATRTHRLPEPERGYGYGQERDAVQHAVEALVDTAVRERKDGLPRSAIRERKQGDALTMNSTLITR